MVELILSTIGILQYRGESMPYRKGSIGVVAAVVCLMQIQPASADPVKSVAKFFLLTLSPSYAGTKRIYKRSGKSFSTTYTNEMGTFVETVTAIDRCTYRYDYKRPSTIATKSTTMQIDLSGYKRSNMTQSTAGKDNYDAVKITGIKACNVGQHLEYWNGHIAPGSCSDTFYVAILNEGERMRDGLNEMVGYCQGKT